MTNHETQPPRTLDELSGFAFDTKQTAQIINCSSKKLEADRLNDRGLPYVRVGGLVRYLGEDIVNSMKQNRHVPGDAA